MNRVEVLKLHIRRTELELSDLRARLASAMGHMQGGGWPCDVPEGLGVPCQEPPAELPSVPEPDPLAEAERMWRLLQDAARG